MRMLFLSHCTPMYRNLLVAFVFHAVCPIASSSLSFNNNNRYDAATTTANGKMGQTSLRAATATPPSPPSSSSQVPPTRTPPLKSPASAPPIVYTVAGSDSGGGAGIQADLHAIHAMGCHGCTAITCLTAQNSLGVTEVHSPPPSFLRRQLEALFEDLPPRAIKIGMLGTSESARVMGEVLRDRLLPKEDGNNNKQQRRGKVWVVLDPVMISTSGSKLLEDDDAVDAMIRHVFPLADVVTPNIFEAEALLRRKLRSPSDVEDGARELLQLGCRSVLIKGGHTLVEDDSSLRSSSDDGNRDIIIDDQQQRRSSSWPEDGGIRSTLKYAQDYLLTSDPPPPVGRERLCDPSSPRGVWLRSPRWDTNDTHGMHAVVGDGGSPRTRGGESEFG
jgi:hydroxymethylpyrimidine kinase/phosphomethylpyrimidine kinase